MKILKLFQAFLSSIVNFTMLSTVLKELQSRQHLAWQFITLCSMYEPLNSIESIEFIHWSLILFNTSQTEIPFVLRARALIFLS